MCQCQRCQIFVYDFFPTAFPHKAPLASQVKPARIRRTMGDLSPWLVRLSHRLSKKDYETATTIVSRISKRGRPDLDYQILQFSSTLNLLKCSNPWIRAELDYAAILLLECGGVRSKTPATSWTSVQDYLSFIVPYTLQCLYDIHDDHVTPKGLMTPVDSLRRAQYEDVEDTLYDRDDYQSEVLAEEDDLYF